MIWSKTVLVWSRLEIFVDSRQNPRIEIGRYEVHREVSLSVFGIGMINEDFYVVTERLKRAVMYSITLGPRCFKW